LSHPCIDKQEDNQQGILPEAIEYKTGFS